MIAPKFLAVLACLTIAPAAFAGESAHCPETKPLAPPKLAPLTYRDAGAGEYEKACAFWESGDTKSAMASYKKAIELSPYTAKYYWELGALCEKLNRYDETIDLYRAVTKFMPNQKSKIVLAGAYLDRAQHRYVGRQFRQSEKDFRTAIKLDDTPIAHFEFALALRNVGRIAEARQQFMLYNGTSDGWKPPTSYVIAPF